MHKDELDYYFVYRPDSFVANDLFADFFKSPRIKAISVYEDFSYRRAMFRCVYTNGWELHKLFAWLAPICNRNYVLSRELEKQDDGRRKCFIFCNSSLMFLSKELLDKLSERDDVLMVLLLIDPVRKISKFTRSKFKYFENGLILTFDPQDAEKYGFRFVDSYYSTVKSIEKRNEKSGVYFCGLDKGRLATLHGIYSFLTDHGVSCEFHIRVPHRRGRRLIEGIDYIDGPIPYPEVINQVCTSECILDVTQKCQTGMTLRYYEAVCYNKKLLTNNVYVKNMPFYNPEYIQVFDDPESIDVEWIKKPVKVDYGYDGRFSPLRLLDAIPSML